MRMLVRPAIVALALCLPAALNAETARSCWQPGTAVGLFDWAGSPSTTCRDGTWTRAGDGTTAPKPAPAPAKTRAASAPTGFSFSGEVYVGLAWAK